MTPASSNATVRESAVACDNYAARDPFTRVARRSGLEVVRFAMNDNAGSTEVEQRMVALTLQCEAGQHGLQSPGAVLGNLEIREVSGVVASVSAVVRLAPRIEMSSCAFKGRRIALRPLVYVNPVRARLDATYFYNYSDFFSSRLEFRPPNACALSIADVRNGIGRSFRTAPAQQSRGNTQPREHCNITDPHLTQDAPEPSWFRNRIGGNITC